jgi:hypothetical protein
MATVVPAPTRAPRPPKGAEGEPERAPSPTAVAGVSAESKPPLDLNRVGVVFVHGIGTQPACETFLDWSGAIVRVLSTWLASHNYPVDPVRRCEYDLSGNRLSFLELDVPSHEGHPAASWVMTEAWWAATTRSPGLGSMTRYVSHAMGPIMAGIKSAYRLRIESRTDTRTAARNLAATDGYPHRELVMGAVPERRRDWIDVLDWIQQELTILAFPPALVVGRLGLAVYAPFRSIPIQKLQQIAMLKTADNWLTHWFGELPDITEDPIQAANVRSRLAAAIKGLQGEGCGRIVVVAHSGGAIVSYTTLCDPAFADLRVDKLITLGEGLALAWRIEGSGGLQPGSRLLGDLKTARPDLQWIDFWSTYDPAPAGPIDPPPGVSVADTSHSTTNRMSILEDHGSYWDNDEEFLIPLLQHIDAPAAARADTRFYRDTGLRTVRQAWRRQRVAVLALWRWIATLGAGIPLAVTTVAALLGLAGIGSVAGPARLGAVVTGWWGTVPFHQIIAGPLDGLAGIAAWPGALRGIGEWGLGSGVVIAAFLILARIGVGRWEAWDELERKAAREAVPKRAGSGGAAFGFLMLTAIAAALSAATLAYLWR